ncbi:hypothetical protein JTB14_037031 [Gonioctena quinquepunctata]|nr:hypothetical protein JTB14_037031 [Gonioctena quinquepunctata]
MALVEMEKSILEKTLEDMEEENELKNKHMVQIKLERQKFVEDAIKTEEELKEIINIREKEILKANDKIEELETQLRLTRKDHTHSETQTTSNNTSVQTELTKGDITDLQKNNEIFGNEAENLKNDMMKLEDDIRELITINDNMNTSMEVLTAENDLYRREQKEWKNYEKRNNEQKTDVKQNICRNKIHDDCQEGRRTQEENIYRNKEVKIKKKFSY